MDYEKTIAALVLAAAAAAAGAQEAGQPTIGYKPADGFTLATPDQSWKLTLGGRIQANWSYTGVDNQPERVGVSQDVSTFRIRRAYAWLKGNAFSPDVTYKLQADWAVPNILDAWVNYRYVDELQVEGGQDIVPFTRQELNSSATLQFIERSIAVDYYKPSYSQGAMVWGKIAKGLAYYNLGAFNGQAQNTLRTTPNTAFNVRAVVNPLGDFPYAETDVDSTPNPLLSIGAAYFLNRIQYGTPADTRNAPYQTGFLAPLTGIPGVDGSGASLVVDTAQVGMFEVDAAFKWAGLYAQGEFFLASAEAKKTVNTADGVFGGQGAKRKLSSMGYYAQAGYFVLPKTLEICARYSAFDPNTSSFTSATDASARHDQRTEISGALNYYAYKHGLKVQAEVSSQGREERSLTAGAGPTDYKTLHNLIGRVQAQVIF